MVEMIVHNTPYNYHKNLLPYIGLRAYDGYYGLELFFL